MGTPVMRLATVTPSFHPVVNSIRPFRGTATAQISPYAVWLRTREQ